MRALSVVGSGTYPAGMLEAATGAEDDATLARRIASAAPATDAAAEAELCRRLAPRIRLYGLKHLRNEAAAAVRSFWATCSKPSCRCAGPYSVSLTIA